MKKVYIGRRTIYGNPYIAPNNKKLLGTTLSNYKVYLWAALNNEQWAKDLYKQQTGIDLPIDFKEKVKLLQNNLNNGDILYCPGCKEFSCKENICHGSVLLKAIAWLNQ